MRTTGHWVIVAVWGAVVLATPIATAEAQQVQAGTLACRGGPDTGFVLGAVTNLDCVLHADSAPDSRYVAAIPNLGIFIGDEEVALIWKVMAPVPWLGLDQLAGSYIHASGAGDNAVSGQFLYQLYANAKKLVGYKIGDDGRLTKVTEASVPYNSTQGLAVA